MRIRIGLLLASLLAIGFVCGDRRPVVFNSLDRPIHVTSTMDDGRVAGGALAPQNALFLSDPPHYPQRVVISVPGGETYAITPDDAQNLLGGEVTGPVIGWRVTESGVVPLSQEELEKLAVQQGAAAAERQ